MVIKFAYPYPYTGYAKLCVSVSRVSVVFETPPGILYYTLANMESSITIGSIGSEKQIAAFSAPTLDCFHVMSAPTMSIGGVEIHSGTLSKDTKKSQTFYFGREMN